MWNIVMIFHVKAKLSKKDGGLGYSKGGGMVVKYNI